jgi:hypothetical protein
MRKGRNMKVGMPQFFVATILSLLAFLAAVAPAFGAGGKKQMAMPDFTKGDKIPDEADHDWNLGATGLRGWMYTNQMSTADARQIYVTKVDKGSPADGIVAVGDVILGVGGKEFSYDPRPEFGKALTVAESEAGGGKLSVIRWRAAGGASGEAGKTETVVVKLPVLGTYSATAPYDCPKSNRILALGCAALAKRIADPKYRENAIPRSLNAMALLAGGDPAYLPLVKKEAQWAAGFSSGGFQPWYYGYAISLLAEYKIATGDESVMPGMRRLVMEAVNGQSVVGSWGHGFAEPDGRANGYGMMNSPGIPLTRSLALAGKAGVGDPIVARSVERSVRLLRFYVGKGCIPYGDHPPWIQTHGDNGKNGMGAVMFNLLGEAKAAEYFSRMEIACHGEERDTGHTGNFFNILWAIPSISLSGPNATGAWMGEFGAWYFDLARQWDGTFAHQGPAQMKGDKYTEWDCTGVYMLAYAMSLKKIYLTGKGESHVPQLSMAEAKSIIDDGHGWTVRDRTSFHDALTIDQLIARLINWSPVVRERAAEALARRKDDVMGRLIALLDAKDLYTRYGACRAIAMQKGRAAPAVAALLKTFRGDDLWLRILSAQALAGIGEPARAAVPEMLERLAKGGDPKNDPRNMEQRYLSYALFDKSGGLLSTSLNGVDRDLLLKAVRAGLQNEDGKARTSLATVYDNLTFDEIKPLLPAVLEAAAVRAPSGIMFSDGIRTKGLALLAKHHIAEAMPLCIDILAIERWGKNGRIMGCLKALQCYRGAAKPLLPRLAELEKQLENHREAKMLQPHLELLRKIIAEIKADDNPPKLRSIKEL